MNEADNHQSRSDPFHADSPLGLDVFSSDGQTIGRISGYLDEVPDDEAGMERSEVDTTNTKGNLIGVRHLVIDGHGYTTQVQIIVPENQLQIDLPGRRATLGLTLAQIREMPHHDVNDDKRPINEGAGA